MPETRECWVILSDYRGRGGYGVASPRTWRSKEEARDYLSWMGMHEISETDDLIVCEGGDRHWGFGVEGKVFVARVCLTIPDPPPSLEDEYFERETDA